MPRRFVSCTATTVLFVAIAQCAAAQSFRPPRTLEGKPDLQGFWTNSSVTQLERPAGVTKLVLTAQEAQTMSMADDRASRVRAELGPNPPSNTQLDGADLAAGRGYNAFWIDPGLVVGRVRGEYRSSWIVFPENGRIPYTTSGRAHATRARQNADNYDGPEGRPLGDRCLATTGRTGPPMVNGLYNNNYQIVQTATHVLILSEMVHHARIVRLNGTHMPGHVRPLFGDSIGWWDGDTLVVETTNFNPLHERFPHPVYLTATGKVTERFTRYSREQIFYAYTVEDPALYSHPWRGEASFNASPQPLFEYACHEGNYAMLGILGGAREAEKRTAK
jgi:hypothetical protein